MKQKIILHPLKGALIAIVLFCMEVQLTAQADTAATRLLFLLPDFTSGIIKLKTGESISAVMNYNTVSEKITFYQNGTYLDLNKPETVDTIFIQNMKFVPFGNVFYEVLVNGQVPLFVQNKSDLKSTGRPAALGTTTQTLGTTSYSKFSHNNITYDLKLPENFKVTPSPVYWVRMNKVMHRIISVRQFLKIFPEQQGEIKEFINRSEINIKKQDDLIKLVSYCNKLIR